MKNILLSTLLLIPFLSNGQFENTLVIIDEMVINPSYNSFIAFNPEQVESLSSHRLKEQINHDGSLIDAILFVKTKSGDISIQEDHLLTLGNENFLTVVHGKLVANETMFPVPFSLDSSRPRETTIIEFEKFTFADISSKKGLIRHSGGD